MEMPHTISIFGGIVNYLFISGRAMGGKGNFRFIDRDKKKNYYAFFPFHSGGQISWTAYGISMQQLEPGSRIEAWGKDAYCTSVGTPG